MNIDKKNPNYWLKPAFRYALILAAIGYLGGAALLINGITRSSSSTAAIGFLYVPFYALAFALPPFFVGLSIGYLKVVGLSKIRQASLGALIAASVVFGVPVYSTYFYLKRAAISREVVHVSHMNEAELAQLLNTSSMGKNKYILGAIAQSPNATSATLHQIATIDNLELHEGMGSIFFDLLGSNRKGLAVMRLVAMHPHASVETLTLLAASPDEYVRSEVAQNPKVTGELLQILVKERSQLMNWGIASNPNTPPEVLLTLSESEDLYTRGRVARNPSSKEQILSRLSDDKDWSVRVDVTLNPKVPKYLLEKLLKDSDKRVRDSANRLPQ